MKNNIILPLSYNNGGGEEELNSKIIESKSTTLLFLDRVIK